MGRKKGKGKGKTVPQSQQQQQPSTSGIQAASVSAPESDSQVEHDRGDKIQIEPKTEAVASKELPGASKEQQQPSTSKVQVTSDDRSDQQVSTASKTTTAGAVSKKKLHGVVKEFQQLSTSRASTDVPGYASQTEHDTGGRELPTVLKTEVAACKEKRQAVAEEEVHGISLNQSMTLGSDLVKRPDYGMRGRKIGLLVNYFPIELPSGNVYHYDVEITVKGRDPKESGSAKGGSSKKFRCLNTKKNREVINKLVRTHEQFRGRFPAYDGRKNLYTKTALKSVPLKEVVDLTKDVSPAQASAGDVQPRRDLFEVTIEPVYKKEARINTISLDPLHALYQGRTNEVPLKAIMAVETILRNGPCIRYVPLNRSFFYPPQSSDDSSLGEGKEIWFGYHQSLILAEWKPVININITATTFRKSISVIDYICEMLRCSPNDLKQTVVLRDSDIVSLSKKLKGVRIKVTHLSYAREYRIVKLTRVAAKQLQFPLGRSEGSTTATVAQYFLQKYRKKLEFANLPCLHMHPVERNVYMPIEVCEIIPGQHSSDKLSESQTTQMIRVASVPPDPRLRKIEEVLRQVNFNNDPCNKEFGIKVSSTPLSIEGRVIDPPNITYSQKQSVRPKNGSWEMKPAKFFKGADINSWVILSLVNDHACSIDDLKTFSGLLRRVGQDSGINFGNLAEITRCAGRSGVVREKLKEIKGKFAGVKLVVVVVQGKSSPHYAEIKRTSETELGLVTQCVQAINVKRNNYAVAGNICQKINTKMGGINSSLTPGEKPAVFNQPVIIIGADVTHPPPGNFNRPSIAAAVGSLDAYPSRYAVTFSSQRSADANKQSVEVIEGLEKMIRELLLAFYRHTTKKPEKIIFYRDGVSEGQFLKVRDHELSAIRKACRGLQAEYRPKITFIVVQKRHHTRFFPQDRRDGIGPKQNVPPGTTVDRGASSHIYFDFFLCSHFGLQGTSRPAHYTVISDDNKFTSDELQKLSYYLCHIYARCTRSISIPAPVMYADLAAYRAAKYLDDQMDESSASSDISDAKYLALQRTWEEIIRIQPELKDKMYFV